MPTVSPIVIAVGAVLAALIAGFFSYVNLVSAKETKVSEFRLSWIDGLRDGIARFTSAVHELVRLSNFKDELSAKEYLEVTADPYRHARESLSSIQLRLNPKHVDERPESPEAKLMAEIQRIREAFLKPDYEFVVGGVDRVRLLAAPLLKKEWERVKGGEPGFRRVRSAAIVVLVVGLSLLAFAAFRVTLVSRDLPITPAAVAPLSIPSTESLPVLGPVEPEAIEASTEDSNTES